MRRLSAFTIVCVLLGASAVRAADPDYSKMTPDLFCPARVVNIVPVHQLEPNSGEKDLGTDSEFAIQLDADQPKTISGSVEVLSGAQPFGVVFSNVSLQEVHVTRKENGQAPSTWTAYRSPPIYFKLPASAALDATWVEMIRQGSDTVTCPRIPLRYIAPSKTPSSREETGATALTDAAIRSQAPSQVVPVIVRSPLDLRDCHDLYRDARVQNIVTPSYPPSAYPASGVVLMKIALGQGGGVIDISIAQSSGNQAIDEAALSAAVHTTYEPAAFLCSPVPGFYVFRANFSAH